MASLTLDGLGGRYPDGTTLNAYPAGAQQVSDEGPSKLGPAVATAVVAGHAATFTGLTRGVSYWVIGTVAGRFLWTWTRVPNVPERPADGEIVHGRDLVGFGSGSILMLEGPFTQEEVDDLIPPGATLFETDGLGPDGQPNIVNQWVKTSE
jgi:hypothetical protein